MSGEALVPEARFAGAGRLRAFPFGVGDLWGGVAAMLVAFPSSVAFGVVIFTAVSPSLAGAGALAGIVGAAALGITAPLVGRNAGFITAPCAPAAAVVAGFAAHLAARGDLSTDRVLAVLALTALLSALFQVAYGALGMGRLIKFIPYQVVSGYLSGVAIIIAAAQLTKLLGVPGKASLLEVALSPQSWSGPAIAVGVSTIVATALAQRFVKGVPGAIIGLSVGVAAYWLLALVRPELRQLAGNALVVGPILGDGPFVAAAVARVGSLSGVRLSDLALVLGPAVTLSVLLSIDTLKTGVVLDALTRTRHHSNRELVAQGVANLASFATGGVPGAGSLGPSLMNVTSGGRTPWGGVLEGLLVLGGFLALGSAMAWVPLPALAGILLVVAFRTFDFHVVRLLRVEGARLDFAVIAAVVGVAAGVGLIQATVVGVCLAILLFIRDQVRGSVVLRKVDLRQVRSARRRSEEEVRLLDLKGADGVVVQLKGNLFFGTTDQLMSELSADLARCRFVLLDFRRVDSMDYTGAHLLAQVQERLRERDGQLLFTGMPSSLPTRQAIEGYLRDLGVVGGQTLVFETRDGALEWMEERLLAEAGWARSESSPPLALSRMGAFRLLGAEVIGALEGSVQAHSVPAGARIFAVGDEGDEIFFVRSGRVHIQLPLENGKRHHLATIGRGDFFGEMSFLDRRVRSANAEAATDTELFVLSRSGFDALAAGEGRLAGPVFEQLARAISQRLRRADAELRALEER